MNHHFASITTLAAALVAAALVPAPAAAQDGTGSRPEARAPTRPYHVVTDSELSWRIDPEFPELDHAVLYGNLDLGGPYVYRLRANGPATIPLHTHGKSEYVTVLRGSVEYAQEGSDRSEAHSCVEGCFLVIPAGRGHQAWLSSGTVLQIHGTGPVEAHEPTEGVREGS